MSFGVIPTGFNRKTLTDIRDSVYNALAPGFGVDRTASPDWPAPESALAQTVDPILNEWADDWETLEACYGTANPNAAAAAALDNLLALAGITRIPAASTAVPCVIFGTEGTIVPEGNDASISETGDIFEADADAEITKDAAIKVTIGIASVLDATEYTVTINATAYPFTSDGSATAEEIAAGLVAELAADVDVDAVDNLDGTFTLTAVDLVTPFALEVDANLEITVLGSGQNYTAAETGAIQALTGTVDTIENPVSGFDSITNLADGDMGRAAETDAEARIRRPEVLRKGKGTAAAIKSRLLSGDPAGVTVAKVYENDTGLTDAEGRPPHSVEALVVGGEDDEIAAAIFDVKAGGIETFGTSTEVVEDEEGFDHDVKFSRPTSRYIHLDVTVDLYAEAVFPDDGLDLIAAALLAYGITHTVGQDVLIQGLEAAGFRACPGIARVTVEADDTAAPGDSPSFGTADLPMAYNQVADFDSSRIAVA